MSFDGFENVAGLSLGLFLIAICTRLLMWFVGELRGQVLQSHTREESSENKADALQDKFAEESASRARLEVEVQFLKSSLAAALDRETGLVMEVEELKTQVSELRRRLDGAP